MRKSAEDGYLTFSGRIEPLLWGKSTYTILRLPPSVARRLGDAKRVEGDINDHPVNLALTRAPPVEGAFLWAGKSLIDRLGVAPGETINVRLRRAPDDRVDVADDIVAALRRARVWTRWERLTAGKRRGLLYRIESARTEATRSKRIAALIAELAE